MNIKHSREKVIQTGLHLFNTEGYNSVGVDKICKTTGMTKGAFYNAFKSKENFLLSCLSFYCDRNSWRIRERLTMPKDKPAVICLEDFYIEMLRQNKELNHGGCLINNVMSELGGISPMVTTATKIHFNELIDIIEPVVLRAQKEGGITREEDSRQIAEFIHTTFFGLLTRLKGSDDYEKGNDIMRLLFKSLQKNKKY